MDKKQAAYVRGIILPVEDAVLHVSDLSIQRGYGVFDFFKIENGHPFFLNDYIERFYHSASIMHLQVPVAKEELKQIIFSLIEQNDLPHSGIKMILTGGYSPDGYQRHDPNLIITQHPLTLPAKEQLESGVRIITHEYVRDLPTAKTINYTMGIWFAEKVREAGAVDVLYHQRGIVSELPRSNFFIVTRDNTVLTPSDNVLRGVTRKNILSLTSTKYKVEEGPVFLEDIQGAKEAFLTSTTKRIIPVVRVDDNVIGTGRPGEVTQALLKDLIAAEYRDQSGK